MTDPQLHADFKLEKINDDGDDHRRRRRRHRHSRHFLKNLHGAEDLSL